MTFSRPLLSAAGALILVLTGCTPTVHLEAAPTANDPVCAEVSVRVPNVIGQNERVWTDAQATAAWGQPSSVLFTCGLEPPAPSAQQCVNIGGVDWLVDETESPRLFLTTYGREPAAQAYVDTTVVSGDTVLNALANAVQQLPKTTECTSADTVDPDAQHAPVTEGAQS